MLYKIVYLCVNSAHALQKNHDVTTVAVHSRTKTPLGKSKREPYFMIGCLNKSDLTSERGFGATAHAFKKLSAMKQSDLTSATFIIDLLKSPPNS